MAAQPPSNQCPASADGKHSVRVCDAILGVGGKGGGNYVCVLCNGRWTEAQWKARFKQKQKRKRKS